MINDVVKHLGKAMVPDIEYVLGQLAESRLNVISPYHIFGKSIPERVGSFPLLQRRELISLAPSGAAHRDNSLRYQALKVFMYGLPRAGEFLGGQSHDIGGVRFDIFHKESTNGLATSANFTHNLSTIPDAIVNHTTIFVNLGMPDASKPPDNP